MCFSQESAKVNDGVLSVQHAGGQGYSNIQAGGLLTEGVYDGVHDSVEGVHDVLDYLHTAGRGAIADGVHDVDDNVHHAGGVLTEGVKKKLLDLAVGEMVRNSKL